MTIVHNYHDVLADIDAALYEVVRDIAAIASAAGGDATTAELRDACWDFSAVREIESIVAHIDFQYERIARWSVSGFAFEAALFATDASDDPEYAAHTRSLRNGLTRYLGAASQWLAEHKVGTPPDEDDA